MTRRYLKGYSPVHSDFGLWTAKPGKDIESGNLSDYIFNMSYRGARPHMTGTITSIARTYLSTGGFDINTAEYTATITHGLGYAPLHVVDSYPRAPGGAGSLGVVTPGAWYVRFIDASVDASNLYVTVNVFWNSPSGAYSPPTTLAPYPISYSIFRDPLP